jgi:hypothetical protein
MDQTDVSQLRPTFGCYAEIPYDQMTPQQQEEESDYEYKGERKLKCKDKAIIWCRG